MKNNPWLKAEIAKEKNSFWAKTFQAQIFPHASSYEEALDYLQNFTKENLAPLDHDLELARERYQEILNQNKERERRNYHFQSTLKEYYTKIQNCSLCPAPCLSSRKNVTYHHFEMPSPHSKFILFVTDHPRTEEENESGRLLSQEQSELLKKIARAMELEEDQYSFTSLIKCFPQSEENKITMQQYCQDYFNQEILFFRPSVIFTLGAFATEMILNRKERLGRIHGQFFDQTFSLGEENWNCKVIPLFHPDFLLINPNLKKATWEDLKKVLQYLQTGDIPH